MTVEAVPFVIDLRVAAGVLRRRALVVLGGIILGALAAIAILVFVPPRFDGRAMMLIRTSQTLDPTAMVKDKMGALSELMPSSLGLGGGSEEELATELALLQSRAVLGAVPAAIVGLVLYALVLASWRPPGLRSAWTYARTLR